MLSYLALSLLQEDEVGVLEGASDGGHGVLGVVHVADDALTREKSLNFPPKSTTQMSSHRVEVGGGEGGGVLAGVPVEHRVVGQRGLRGHLWTRIKTIQHIYCHKSPKFLNRFILSGLAGRFLLPRLKREEIFL